MLALQGVSSPATALGSMLVAVGVIVAPPLWRLMPQGGEVAGYSHLQHLVALWRPPKRTDLSATRQRHEHHLLLAACTAVLSRTSLAPGNTSPVRARHPFQRYLASWYHTSPRSPEGFAHRPSYEPTTTPSSFYMSDKHSKPLVRWRSCLATTLDVVWCHSLAWSLEALGGTDLGRRKAKYTPEFGRCWPSRASQALYQRCARCWWQLVLLPFLPCGALCRKVVK